MNKWQIICPLAALFVVGAVIGIVAVKSQHRAAINMTSRSIGGDLVTATNSSRLAHMSPYLRERLAHLLRSPTQVAAVLSGDAPPPVGNGSACSRLVLTNNAGQRLLIRLRQAGSDKFEVVGFRDATE